MKKHVKKRFHSAANVLKSILIELFIIDLVFNELLMIDLVFNELIIIDLFFEVCTRQIWGFTNYSPIGEVEA